MKKILLCCISAFATFIAAFAQQPKVRSYLDVYDFDKGTHQIIKDIRNITF